MKIVKYEDIKTTVTKIMSKINSTVTDINNKLNTKVDKKEGFGLSENSYTDLDEEKLENLPDHPSRNATFVIASYDSTLNSRDCADRVVEKTDDFIAIINEYISKLPEYGGKIQLTEGTFVGKSDDRIVIDKHNVIIEGYGTSTHINLDNTDSSFLLMGMDCGIKNFKITTAASSAISIQCYNVTIQNIQLNHKGSFAALLLDRKSKCAVIENCHIFSKRTCVYFIKDSLDSSLINCFLTSEAGTGCQIEGDNNLITNCIVRTQGDNAFYIKGEFNSITNSAAINGASQYGIYIEGDGTGTIVTNIHYNGKIIDDSVGSVVENNATRLS